MPEPIAVYAIALSSVGLALFAWYRARARDPLRMQPGEKLEFTDDSVQIALHQRAETPTNFIPRAEVRVTNRRIIVSERLKCEEGPTPIAQIAFEHGAMRTDAHPTGAWTWGTLVAPQGVQVATRGAQGVISVRVEHESGAWSRVQLVEIHTHQAERYAGLPQAGGANGHGKVAAAPCA
jgi:hypothetical protein